MDSSMHYYPRPQGRGKLCIELSTVPRGIVSTILPNKHEISVLLHNGAETNTVLLAINRLIGARGRKSAISHGILVTLNVIGYGIVKNYTTLIPHYVYMGVVTGMVHV